MRSKKIEHFAQQAWEAVPGASSPEQAAEILMKSLKLKAMTGEDSWEDAWESVNKVVDKLASFLGMLVKEYVSEACEVMTKFLPDTPDDTQDDVVLGA